MKRLVGTNDQLRKELIRQGVEVLSVKLRLDSTSPEICLCLNC